MKGMFLMRIVPPTQSMVWKRFSATVVPMTQTLAAARMSASVKKSPFCIAQLRIVG